MKRRRCGRRHGRSRRCRGRSEGGCCCRGRSDGGGGCHSTLWREMGACKEAFALDRRSSLVLDKFDVGLHRIRREHRARSDAEVFKPPTHHQGDTMPKSLGQAKDDAFFGLVVDQQRAQQRHLLPGGRADHPLDFLRRRIRPFVLGANRAMDLVGRHNTCITHQAQLGLLGFKKIRDDRGVCEEGWPR